MLRTLRISLAALLLGSLTACGAAESAGSADEAAVAAKEPKVSITVPAGARFRVSLLDGVSTTKSTSGDAFEASLVEPVVVDGKTIFEKGTKVKGRVTDVQESGRVKGRASIRLVLSSVAHNGGNIAIETKPFVAVAEATKGRDAAIIGGGAGVGAAIGAIAGGKKGAGVGALVGGGAGTGTVLATKGKELHYPPETKLNFTLASAVQIEG